MTWPVGVRYDTCACGARKREQSMRCRECNQQHRREYMAAKMRERYHADPQFYYARQRDKCACGAPKLKRSQTCRRCCDRSQVGKTKRRTRLKCYLCQLWLVEMTWRGRMYLRCPGCGLERRVRGYMDEVLKEAA